MDWLLSALGGDAAMGALQGMTAQNFGSFLGNTLMSQATGGLLGEQNLSADQKQLRNLTFGRPEQQDAGQMMFNYYARPYAQQYMADPIQGLLR